MNDDQVLERLAETDLLAPGTEMPVAAWSRDAARSQIEWRIGMQTEQHTPQKTQRTRPKTGWLVAAAAFIVVVVSGAAIWFLGPQQSDVANTPPTEAPAPTTIPTTAVPQLDLTGSYVGELFVWFDDLWGPDNIGQGSNHRVPFVVWLELDGNGDTYSGDLVLTHFGLVRRADGGFEDTGGILVNDPEDPTRFPVVDVVAAGDQLTLTWDPTIGPLEDAADPCRFGQVTLMFAIQESGALLADASGSLTLGDDCEASHAAPTTPIPIDRSSLLRGDDTTTP